MQTGASQVNVPIPTGLAGQAAVNMPTGGDPGSAGIDQLVQQTAASYTSCTPEHPHPPPSQPLRLEARRLSMPMHQPRPQKLVSLTTIDSPSSMPPPPPSAASQEQQPFHQQMPAHMNTSTTTDINMDRQPSFQEQYPAIMQLSSIPEVAINARPFQPGSSAGQQAFYPPQYSQQQMYYYQQSEPQTQYPSLAYVQDGGYYVPLGGQVSGQAPGQHETAQDGLIQEANGMMYYYDPNHYPGSGGQQQYGMSVPQGDSNYYYGQEQGAYYGQ
jgi:hypothetical protein